MGIDGSLFTFASLLRGIAKMEFNTLTLDNGIRLIHQHTNSPVAHCGIIINTGSRDELEHQHGLAHFIEHLIFKGTKKRKAHQILSRMEDVGGEMNAFTTKEETCLITSFFNNYYSRAFEILTDILFQSTFPEKEIGKEKDVIIDEINSYKDSPVEQLYDDFEELIFRDNAIARNILGTQEALDKYSRQDILDFFASNYNTPEIVVSSVGNMSFRRVSEYFKKYFSDIDARVSSSSRKSYDTSFYKANLVRQEQNTYQAHCIIGNLAYGNREDKRMALHLLNNLLGGPSMNSRLHMVLREKNGLAYNVESNYNTYSDIGIITIYFGTDKEDIDKCLGLIHKELKKTRETQLGTIQLSRAKRQLIGQLAMAADNNEHQMISNGRSMLLFDKVDTIKELNDKINKISALELMEVSNEILDPKNLSQLIFY